MTLNNFKYNFKMTLDNFYNFKMTLNNFINKFYINFNIRINFAVAKDYIDNDLYDEFLKKL